MTLPEGTAPLLASKLDLKHVVPDHEPSVQKAVGADRDIAEFCRFYDSRKAEELSRAGNDPHLLYKLNSHLTPSVTAEVVAADGFLYEEARVRIRFTIDGSSPYEVTLGMVPASGQILSCPRTSVCAKTRRVVPGPCLARCDVSKQEVLQHLLVQSAFSDRRGLAEYRVTCQASGKQALVDEVAASALTGKKAHRSFFQVSEVSGRLGLPEDLARCEFTETLMLLDEMVRSQVSGKRARKDQCVASGVSGKLGHITEMVRCQKTRDWLAPEEAGKSAYSGKIVRKDLLLLSEKPPGRLGLAEEFAVCSRSDKRLLLDEVARSVVSGELGDRGLLTPSAWSGQLAFPHEMVKCGETGRLLLPSEVAVCTLTEQAVDSRLLAICAVSGKVAL